MKIYLDSCALQRPFDTKDSVRILLEADAILGVLDMCDAGKVQLVSSDALVYETHRIPTLARQNYAFEVLSKATIFMAVNAAIEQQASTWNLAGLRPLDALHLALAQAAQVDYFCTCDDRFLKKASTLHDLRIRVVSPLKLIEELEYADSDQNIA